MSCIDKNAKGIALVVKPDHCFIGTVTDGDIRRAILAGIDLTSPVQVLLDQRASTPYPVPITATRGTSEKELISLMTRHSFRHIPLLDEEGHVVDLALLSDLIKQDDASSFQVVIMAGGYGRRLRPLTKNMPKPLLPVNKKSILELLLRQLKRSGIRQVHISTHYKADKITDHLGDGKLLGIEIRYIKERHPLGTAGALGLMENLKGPLLVVNGDIVTKVNFQAMLAFHQEQKADMTVAVQKYDVKVSYGVIETEGFAVRRLTEKPKLEYLINAGIYLLQPSVLRLIPKGRPFDMTDLIQKLLDQGRPIASFPIREYWLDIGNHADYKRARGDAKEGNLKT